MQNWNRFHQGNCWHSCSSPSRSWRSLRSVPRLSVGVYFAASWKIHLMFSKVKLFFQKIKNKNFKKPFKICVGRFTIHQGNHLVGKVSTRCRVEAPVKAVGLQKRHKGRKGRATIQSRVEHSLNAGEALVQQDKVWGFSRQANWWVNARPPAIWSFEFLLNIENINVFSIFLNKNINLFVSHRFCMDQGPRTDKPCICERTKFQKFVHVLSEILLNY